ncbi:MAG: PH domain-containing protein [Candidatus Aenigmarchaeota archaeon]|nr:PH domain-containing protein [Candidatus Aenigmarchaeota archaeon]
MGEEKWVLRYRPTRFSFILNYFLAGLFLIILFSLLPFLNLRVISSKIIFFILLGGIIFLVVEPEVKIARKEYVLTQESVICYEELFKKKSIEIPYIEIKNLNIEQNLLDKFIECGDVLIESDKEKIKMAGINNPGEAYKIIQHKIGQIKLPEGKKEPEKVSE